MSFEFVPFYECVFCYPDGAVLVALIASELLIDPRMSISREAQTTLWFPLFNRSDKTFDAVLASICEVFLVLDDLAYFPDKGEVVTDHSI